MQNGTFTDNKDTIICKLYVHMETQARFIIDRRRAKSNGEYPIKLYFYLRGKQNYISTGMSAKNGEFDNLYTPKAVNWRARNTKLLRILSEVESYLSEIELDGKMNRMYDSEIKEKITDIVTGESNSKKKLLFTDIIREYTKKITKIKTIESYQYTISKINTFDSKATINSITIKWLNELQAMLEIEELSTNTISIVFRNIRTVFNYAIDEEITQLYPFRKFKIKSEHKLAVEYLTFDQLKKLQNYKVQDYQVKARDIFMLMFYLCGINIGDLCKLRTIEKGRINYKRQKTGRIYSIKVEPEAMEIIDRYRGESYLLDILDHYQDYIPFMRKMNNDLSLIGEMKRVGLGGKKIITPLFPDITTYWSRYSWGTLAAQLDIPKETISAGLGHGARSVTDNYVHFDIKKVDEANRKIIDHLNKL